MTAFTSQIIAESIDYLVAHADESPDLSHLAARAGYETTYFQKLFKENVGLSPKKLIQYMKMRQARELLLTGQRTLDAAHDAGISGNARLHDLFVTIEGATPGSVQKRGAGVTITYGYHPTVLGEILIGQTDKGVCWLGFVMGDDRDYPFMRLQKHWPEATLVQDEEQTARYASWLMDIWSGQGSAQNKLPLDLYGTNFQIQVWQALLQIPSGSARTYQDVGMELGRPQSSRAIGNAVGANPISVLIPCHRVIRATGIIDNYAWGSPRKKLILGLENR